ncbi:MAG TPA: hypothetical protein VF226_04075 [Hyphomicrobiaceae bacterium]|jgi:hypothetical protein
MANPDEHRSRRLLSTAVPVLVALGVMAGDAIAQEETPLEILAVRVREQGFPCDRPIKAERDQSASRPLSTVWFLDCGNARYRVVLHPDMGAEIQLQNR